MNTAPSKQQKVVLDILVGNEWRHIFVTAKRAQFLIQNWQHRGYLVTPVKPS